MASNDTTRSIPIHHSLLRPQLLGGGERTLVLLNATLTATLIFGVGGFAGISTGIVIGSIVQWLLIVMAKRDDRAFDVFRRHIHYQTSYPASAAPDATQPPSQPFKLQ